MTCIKNFIVVLSLSLFFISCSEDNPAGNGNNNSGTANITITVSSGTNNPQYSWSGDNVFSVTVVRTSEPGTPIWGITTPGQDNIQSPATHGVIPGEAIQISPTETSLSGGVQYRVTVARINGSDVGFTDFTPIVTALQ